MGSSGTRGRTSLARKRTGQRAAVHRTLTPSKPKASTESKPKPLSYKQRGWYMPQKDGDGFLSGVKCPICQRAFKKDQSAYAWSIETGGWGREVRRYLAMHGACMASEASGSPIEKWSEIRDKIKNGKGLFD